MTAGLLKHRVCCLGFVLQEEETLGNLEVSKVMPLINQHRVELTARFGRNPNSLLSLLKQPDGEITLPDGTVIHSRDVLTPNRPGRKLVHLGDTCDSSSLLQIAMLADLLVHEATNAFLSGDEKTTLYEQILLSTLEHGHSSRQMAGEFAKAIKAKRMVLTHFSARYIGDDQEESLAIMNEICFLTKESF